MRLGVDVVSIERMEARLHKENFIARYFTAAEQDYLAARPKAETLAGLWAAKEAMAKALGMGLVPRELEVSHDADGRPTAVLHGQALAQLQALGGAEMTLSIAHDGGVAMAAAQVIGADADKPSLASGAAALFGPDAAAAASTRPDASETGAAESSPAQRPESVLNPELALSLLRRDRDGYKYQYGKVAVVGGSTGMVGAVCLAAEAALRAGAGLVLAVVPKTIAPLVQGKLLEAIVVPAEDEGTGHFTLQSLPAVRKALAGFRAVAIGPGLGQDVETQAFAQLLLASLDGEAESRPFRGAVLDADGINAFAGQLEKLAAARMPLLLTPHEMEMARLAQVDVADIRADRDRAAREVALAAGACVALKGADTVVTDGETTYWNDSGNPGMATAGSGDVLTGMCVALLGFGYPPLVALRLAVYLHGLAGDLGAAALGENSLIASDLLRFLPAAFVRMEQARNTYEKSI